ncbi:MAG: GspE/PulE family protein [Verrucomicrobiae bacterium]|nr:GspE/PulE family protein [Verrucomicrobiae bacterium]
MAAWLQIFRQLAEKHGAILDAPWQERLSADNDEFPEFALDDLLDLPTLREEPFLRELAAYCGMDWWPEPAIAIPQNLLGEIPVRLALQQQLAPIQKTEEGLIVLIHNPFNLVARQLLARAVNGPVHCVMTSRNRLRDAIREGYGLGADTLESILAGRADDKVFDHLHEEANRLDAEDTNDASVITFVNHVLREAIRQEATDIHIEPLESELRIRLRIDGVLRPLSVPASIKQLQDSVISRLKIMARLDIAERRLPQDGRINLEIEGKRIDVRVAAIPTVTGETLSLRLLASQQFDLPRLGLDPELEKKLRNLLTLPNGIVLVTGPTGSGKSTTLYSLLSCLNEPGRRIITIEDPVEFKIPGINQIAVHSEIGLTFAAGLRSILRADPNIIMVGEMRDLETTETAIRSALTGHLVFSTLHTNDAVSSITRLIDMGIEPYLVATSVRAFLAQRLVRQLCPECRKPVSYTMEQLQGAGITSNEPVQFWEPVGCPACRQTGYQGRFVIMELCVVTPRLQELISEKASYNDLLKQAMTDGMKLLRADGLDKAMAGQTSLAEIQRVTTVEKEASAA